MKISKGQVISNIAGYANENLDEPFVILCKDGDTGLFLCNAETEDELIALSANVNSMMGDYGTGITGKDDYRQRIALTEVYGLLQDKKIHPGTVIDMITEGSPYVFLKIAEMISFGPAKSVAADGVIDDGADTGDKTNTMFELLSLTLSSFIQKLSEGETAVCETPVHAMAFIQATLNNIIGHQIEIMKQKGEVPECFTFSDVGSNPIVHTKLGQETDDLYNAIARLEFGFEDDEDEDDEDDK